MMIRAIALSLALLIGIGVIMPLATQQTEAGPRKHRHHKHYKKYSKQWWRAYRKRMKRRRALQARKRALRLRQLRLAKQRELEKGTANPTQPAAKKGKQETSTTATLPSGDPAPSGWKAAKSSPAELQFRVDNSSGDQVGSAAISVVGPAVSNGGEVSRNSVGGVSTAALRRDVIDKMIKENGWVVNDYQKEIAGQSVYVVVAQSQARSGAVQSRMFYFTEVGGRIYSVATNSPVQEAERLAEESEKVINSLKSRVRPTQRASAN
jgi:hypothetical protein